MFLTIFIRQVVYLFMREVSRKLFSILNSSEFKEVQFLDIQLVGQSPSDTFHFTDAGQQVTWNGIIYYPIGMKRGAIQERVANQSGSVPSMEMMLSNVDRQMAAILARSEFEGATATLWLADRRLLSNPRDAVRLTFGEVRNIGLSETMAKFEIVTVIGIQERISIPKRAYMAYCNYEFGSFPHCGVDLNYGVDQNNRPIQYQTTVQAGSTDNYIIIPSTVYIAALSPTNFYTDFFETGYIVMQSGVVGLQDRPINSVQSFGGAIRVNLNFPLTAAPATGDSVVVRRNCRLTKSDCSLYHDGSPLQFGGFQEAPPYRFKPTKHPTPNFSNVVGP